VGEKPSTAFDEIPPSTDAEVWVDFDGTLTTCDVVDLIIRDHCATDEWRRLEEAWQAGRIGSRACLAGQLELVQADKDQLLEFVESLSLDPGAASLLALLRRHGVRATIVSDGIDWIIERIFRAHRLEPPSIRSNSLVRKGGSWKLICPHASNSCSVAAAHCKCASIERLATPGRARIYVGDGRSDLCAARKAHTRFAKGTLAAQLKSEGLSFIPYQTLHDVCQALGAAWSRPKSLAA
jgi:2-hydroxy-3-keto-5-methylthiopentenyl-1-phosphate phosphatase